MFSFLNPYPKKMGKIHSSINDLHIDELLEMIEKDKDSRHYILNVLADFEENIENIKYRQDTIKDFIQFNHLYDDLLSFFKRSVNIGDIYRAVKKERIGVQKFFSTYNIDNYDTSGILFRRYAESIKSIIKLYKDIFSYIDAYSFNSDALKGFKSIIEKKVKNSSIDSLYSLMDKIIEMQGTYDILVVLNNKFQVVDSKIIMDYVKEKEEFHFFKKKKDWETTNVDVNSKTIFEMDFFITSATIKVIDRLSKIFEDFYDVFSETSKELTFIKFALDFEYLLKKLKIDYVFPDFNDEYTDYEDLKDPYLCIKAYYENGKILDMTANRFYKDKKDGGVLVVGENNTGKTVYTRSIGINQVFAQSGLMVSAKKADIKIYHQLITCYASKESHEFDGGRFETEVRALKYILDEACDNTLIIVNEIFQSTAQDEGTKALYNVLSYMTFTNISWICVSHFLELANMADGFLKENNKSIHLMRTRHVKEKEEERFYIDTVSK